ncbi:hypothetical protein BH10ACT11_BH10ACT11_16640 [soil metagenome]
MSKLARANLLVLGLLVLHIVDHGANQPMRTMPGSSTLVGVGGFVLVAASSVLAIRRNELAPMVSLFTGFATIFGFVVVHLLPNWWSWVSDPFWSFSPNALSWILLAAPILASAYLAVVASREVSLRAPQPE